MKTTSLQKVKYQLHSNLLDCMYIAYTEVPNLVNMHDTMKTITGYMNMSNDLSETNDSEPFNDSVNK